MPAEITVQMDPAQRRRVEAALAAIPHGLTRVLTRAVNRVATSQRSKIVKHLSSVTGLQQKILRRRNVFLRRASFQKPSATIAVRGGRIPLRDLQPRQTKGGVSWKDGKGRGMEWGAFIVESLGGHVFERVSPRRLPIRKLFSSSLASAFEKDGYPAAVQRDTAEQLAREVDTQTTVLLRQRELRR